MTIAVHLIIITLTECYGVWWCGDKTIDLLIDGRQTGGAEDARHLKILGIIKHITWGRIAVILFLLVPAILSLYARQLKGIPFNH